MESKSQYPELVPMPGIGGLSELKEEYGGQELIIGARVIYEDFSDGFFG